jgi:hypothetical protein
MASMEKSMLKATYIGAAEKGSRYFRYPFSKPRQDALLYTVARRRPDTPLMVVSVNRHKIAKVVYFDDSEKRAYSRAEYEAALAQIGKDHEHKDRYASTLAQISRADAILDARKIALFRLKHVAYDLWLSVYHTHKKEYAATVYVIDIIKNGETVYTKEKHNFDGPY